MGKTRLFSFILEISGINFLFKSFVKNSQYLSKFFYFLLNFFLFSKKISQLNSLKLSTCCKPLLSITILYLTECYPQNAIVSDFSGDISISKCFALFCNANNPLCNLFSESAIMTLSSAKDWVLIFAHYNFVIPTF
jgi:hypothetical protein